MQVKQAAQENMLKDLQSKSATHDTMLRSIQSTLSVHSTTLKNIETKLAAQERFITETKVRKLTFLLNSSCWLGEPHSAFSEDFDDIIIMMIIIKK